MFPILLFLFLVNITYNPFQFFTVFVVIPHSFFFVFRPKVAIGSGFSRGKKGCCGITTTAFFLSSISQVLLQPGQPAVFCRFLYTLRTINDQIDDQI